MRGDEVEYKTGISPYGVAHVLTPDDAFVAFKAVDESFTPKRKLAVGCLAVTLTRPYIRGKVVKLGNKKKKNKQAFLL